MVLEVAPSNGTPAISRLRRAARATTAGEAWLCDSNNSTQVETIRAAAKTLSSVEQIQALTGKVVDEQLQRLEGRCQRPDQWRIFGREISYKGMDHQADRLGGHVISSGCPG